MEAGRMKKSAMATTTQHKVRSMSPSPPTPSDWDPGGPGISCRHSLSVQYDWDWRRIEMSLRIANSWFQMHSQGS